MFGQFLVSNPPGVLARGSTRLAITTTGDTVLTGGVFLTKQRVVLGRSNSPDGVFSDAILEIDTRTAAGGHPDGGWPIGTPGLWLVCDSFNTAAPLQVHCSDSHDIVYVSETAGSFMFRIQANAPFADYQWLTTDDGGNLAVKMTMGAGRAVTDDNINFKAQAHADAGLTIGSGDKIVKHLHEAATLDFPSVAAGGDEELTVTVTGTASGDTVVTTPAAGIEAGLVWCAYVSAADTVTVRVANPTASPIDPASRAWSVDVWQH